MKYNCHRLFTRYVLEGSTQPIIAELIPSIIYFLVMPQITLRGLVQIATFQLSGQIS